MSNRGVPRNPMPSVAGLRAFVAIGRTRHFREAAAALGISQPSLSQALAGLEATIGVQLVERSSRRVLLTEAGVRLLPRAIEVIDAIEAFSTDAAGFTDRFAAGVRLGLIPTVAPYLLPAVLAHAHDRRTILVTEEQTHRLVDQLVAGTLDAAVMALPANVAGMVEIGLYDEDFVLALPPGHKLADRKTLNPKTLADLPLLLLDDGHCLRDQALDVCQTAGVTPTLAATRAASLATAVRCVAGGLGATLLPASAVASESSDGRLALVRFAKPVPSRRIGLVYRASLSDDTGLIDLATLIRESVADDAAFRVCSA